MRRTVLAWLSRFLPQTVIAFPNATINKNCALLTDSCFGHCILFCIRIYIHNGGGLCQWRWERMMLKALSQQSTMRRAERCEEGAAEL